MRILIIEDSQLKAAGIKRCLTENYPDVEIDEAAAYASGVRKAYRESYDVIIMDNSLPYYESEPYSIQPDMARIILEEFEDLQIRPKCIICSAFEPGGKEIYFESVIEKFPNCLGFVRHDSSSSEWEEKLIGLINREI